MGRPPSNGGPVFRFTQNEVLEMEACLQEIKNAVPPREVICSLSEKFSGSAERAGKIIVQPKQVWNWFQNRRYSQRQRTTKAPGKLSVSTMPRDESFHVGNIPNPVSAPPGKTMENSQTEFEAKSARDGAWYDVAAFVSHRMFETGDPEVRVHFSGFGVEEDEWVNVIKCVRQRSLPCEAGECVVVLPGDLILCFQEGKEQALYFDAHVLDAQRRRHDVRGCRCRFLVRYDHDQSEEIVPLRKICRRPETDYRLQILQASRAAAAAGAVGVQTASRDSLLSSSSKDSNLAAQKPRKQRKLMDVNTDEKAAVQVKEPTVETSASSVENSNLAVQRVEPTNDTEEATMGISTNIPQEENAAAC